MDDSLTIRFLLPLGKTPLGHRPGHMTAFVRHEPDEARLDPTQEDLGVGRLLDDPEIIGVHVAWLDDYDDNNDPILAITGTFRTAPLGSPNARPAIQVMMEAIPVPYHPSGVQIMEWIATYMRDNVYHDGMDPNS